VKSAPPFADSLDSSNQQLVSDDRILDNVSDIARSAPSISRYQSKLLTLKVEVELEYQVIYVDRLHLPF
jgi:hypothetical protein